MEARRTRRRYDHRLRDLVHETGYYVEEHNSRLPHSAFRGQTPDEMYFETGHGVPDDLEIRRKAARAARVAANRARSCRVCREEVGE